MGTYDFVLIVDGLDLTSDEDLDRLFEAGLDDAAPSVVDTVQYLDVSREAGSYGQALSTALRQVGAAGATVRHVLEVDEDGQPRPGLVSLADIARRTGWTREYIRLLASGKRGPGDFPARHRDWLRRCTHGPTSLSGWPDIRQPQHPPSTSATGNANARSRASPGSRTSRSNSSTSTETCGSGDLPEGSDVASLIERKGKPWGHVAWRVTEFAS